ncbi:uncharacterized protein (TIGR02444 family) [Dongia mobilis]|uniref:Uncharacterized protein (TIGR02444 family) n=1 Tax=Dongia mobilis TaxID=578943 RepID=A0A4R6WWC7_9PROT|nr:TIGR02444 family protein [Dongia mobilis]TDQ84500.1 uncharacterized protein (TIGR02444 family) [Dongia mobilis]
MAIRLDPADFWSFSLALYCRPPVAQACLDLQDRRGADVNLLLAICWLAARGYETGVDGIEAAERAIASWNEAVLKPLRTTRRRLVNDFPDLARADRQSIKHGILSVELECEKVAQVWIAKALEPHAGSLSTLPARQLATAGFDRYLSKLVGIADGQDRTAIDTILNQL